MIPGFLFPCVTLSPFYFSSSLLPVPEKGVPDWWKWTKYEIGKFEITGNRVSESTELIEEIPNDSEILGPHVLENNGPEAEGAKDVRTQE